MTDLAVIEPGPIARMTPGQVKEWVQQVQEMRRSVLEQGIDFMLIPGTPKPSLLQAGAEKMLMLAGGSFTMGQISRTDDGVTYGCSVVIGDRHIQSEGHAGRDERNLKNAPWNTVIKMAQKRAKVGAISSALALSGLFTQDIDDAQVNTVDIVAPYLEQLDDEGKQELKEWRKEAGLPGPSEMTLEQMAGVLVHIGLIAGERAQAERDGDNERVQQELDSI